MPTKRRVGKAHLLDDYRRQQLLDGPDASSLGAMGYLGPFRAGTVARLTEAQYAEMLAAMRDDWGRFGGEMMDRWRRGEYEPDTKPWIFVIPGGVDRDPWAWEQFGDPREITCD